MSFSIHCESCGQKLKASEEHIGKRTKCPKCKATIEIRHPEPEPDESEADFSDGDADDGEFDFAAAAEEQRAVPVSRSSPKPAPPRILPPEPSRAPSPTAKRQFSTSILAAVASATLILGYFIGREHLKYQMASAFQAAGEAFSEGMRKAFDPEKSNTKALPVSETPVPEATTAPATAPEKPPEVKAIGLNEPYRTDSFEITLQRASIELISVKSQITRNVVKSEEPAFKMTFLIKNIHDRKMLRFSENMFDPCFSLVDDVGNIIRRVNYGASSTPVDALSSRDDIPPGETRTHVEIFAPPLPKTEHVVLTMDAKAFGGEGNVEFKIPSNAIQR